ncbi:MAG: phosphatidylglycerophosphatase A [Gammaproteobacteria bacterium]|nr:phosphatidylglycerophosphatase A [Gammaproteobacteria bacterium]MDH3429888.1 phosphatidylglycerophosphatase A [Gammaproteobacteria bacterium]
MKDPEQNLVRRVLTDPVHILAFGLGTGLAPFAPGTVGSLLGVLLAWLTLDLGLTTQIGLAVLLFVAGIWICGESSKRLGVHDHGGIVWDEVAGMFVTLLAAPATLRAWILGFLLFRAFDIVKPWPIRDLDHRLGGGLGIMLDDLVAALYAAVLLALYGWLMT